MGTLVKVAAFGAFYRLMSVCFMFTFAKAETILIIVSVITLFAGNLIALAQHNFKRLLAYSGISHAGYLLIAIVSLRTNTASALFYYSLGYALSTIAAFAVAIAVFEQVGTEEIKGFNGLGKKNPFLAACLTMAMLGLGGIPPFAGFLGKYYIFTKALSNGYFWLVLMAIINSVIGIWYYFKVIIAMYGQHANDREVKGTFSTYLVVAVCILLSIVLGVYPSLVINLL
jgi:NADH-quinone oxidoreductase subunit N